MRSLSLPASSSSRCSRKRRRGGRRTFDWALEAHKAARDVAVAGVTMDAHLGADYLAAVRPTLDRQLAVAGLRLARTLNEALK
jgi:hypothetical protein